MTSSDNTARVAKRPSVLLRHEHWTELLPAIRLVAGTSLAGREARRVEAAQHPHGGLRAAFSALLRAIGDEWMMLRAKPMIDDAQASQAAGLILAQVWQIRGMSLRAQGDGWRWTWQGRLKPGLHRDGTLLLRNGTVALQIDATRVRRIARCGYGRRSGIVMYDERRAFLTLWSNQTRAFDKWLAAIVASL